MDILMRAHILNSIRTILKNKNISQRKLATLLGKSPTQVNKWILGKNEIGVNTLVDIANALEIGTDELLGRIIDKSISVDDLKITKEAKALDLDLKSIRTTIKGIISDLAVLKAGISLK